MKLIVLMLFNLAFISVICVNLTDTYRKQIDYLERENKELQSKVDTLDFNFKMCKFVLRGDNVQ